jgi:hypothetical protein
MNHTGLVSVPFGNFSQFGTGFGGAAKTAETSTQMKKTDESIVAIQIKLITRLFVAVFYIESG